MKLSTSLAAFTSFFVLTVSGEALVPELVPVAKDTRLLPRVSTLITFCSATGFHQCQTYAPLTDICYGVPVPYVDSLFSSRASSGFVCFLYREAGCNGCEACADAVGWGDMTNFAAVRSFKCIVADAAGCSDAFSCTNH